MYLIRVLICQLVLIKKFNGILFEVGFTTKKLQTRSLDCLHLHIRIYMYLSYPMSSIVTSLL